LTGGLGRNRAFLNGLVEGGALGLSIAATVPTAVADLLFDSETSGGLFFSVPPEDAPEVSTRFAARGESVWEIGEVIPEVALHIN
jgi:selenophosphate synthase